MTQKRKPKGTGHVLSDLGIQDAGELSAKAMLAVKLNDLIDLRELTQATAATITGMTQRKISEIRCYKLQNISLECLIEALISLDQDVEIIVKPTRRRHTSETRLTKPRNAAELFERARKLADWSAFRRLP